MSEKKINPHQDYKVMVDMVKEAEEQLNIYRDIVKNSYEADNISFGRSKFLFDAYTQEELRKMDDDVAKEALLKIRIPFGPMDMKNVPDIESDEDWIKDICSQHYESKNTIDKNLDPENLSDHDEKENDVAPFEEVYPTEKFNLIREVLVKLKEDFVSLEESENNVKELKDETEKVLNEYSNYMCSPEYEQKQIENIKRLNERIVSLREDKEKMNTFEINKIQKKIDTLEKIINGSFITERLDKLGTKEVESIVKTYFNNNKSAYIIERFKNKIEKVGFNSSTYRFFFNIEEKYLPEEYHVYNNLYLFIVMRFIAYININDDADRSYVRSIVSSISKLIYEKYNDTNKEKFINSIKKCLDYFEDYKERFEKDNILHPNHPRRIERDEKKKKEERAIMLKTLELNKYPITKELTNMDLDDLKKEYTRILDEIENSKKDKEIGDINEFIQKNKKVQTSSFYGDIKKHESNDDEEPKEEVCDDGEPI